MKLKKSSIRINFNQKERMLTSLMYSLLVFTMCENKSFDGLAFEPTLKQADSGWMKAYWLVLLIKYLPLFCNVPIL